MRKLRKLSPYGAVLPVLSVLFGCGDSDDPSEEDITFDGDEVYLATVYTLPSDEFAADSVTAYTLEAVGAESSVVFSEAQPRARRSPVDPSWTARHEHHRKLYEGMAAVGRALEAGTLSFDFDRWGGSRMALRRQASVGDERTFTLGEGAVDATLRATEVDNVSGLRVNLYVDDRDNVDDGDAARLASGFLDAAGEVLFLTGQDNGHTGVLDRDGDGAISVVLSDAIPDTFGAGIVGVFQFTDLLADGSQAGSDVASGNESDLLWGRAPSPGVSFATCIDAGGCSSDEIPMELALSTLAHEYQHLLNFATRAFLNNTVDLTSRETVWLDEGISHTIEDLVGLGNSTQDNVLKLFENWEFDGIWAGARDSEEQRGMTYTLIRHVIDQRAKQLGASDAGSPQTRTAGREVISSLITGSSNGYLQPLFQDLGARGIGDWLVGLYATNNPEVDITPSVTYLPRSADAPLALGFDPFLDPLYTARGEAIFLEGPPRAEDEEIELTTVDGELNVSQAAYYTVTGSGTTTLQVNGPADIDYQLRVERIR